MFVGTNACVRTLSQRSISLDAIGVDDILLGDIAHSLSQQCRFNGHTPHFYSVAEHSVLVADRLPASLKVWGLMHDAAEAYVGDLISPIKREIRSYRNLEDRLLGVIAERFGLCWPVPDMVFAADKAQIAAEMCSLRGCWSSSPQDVSFWSPAVAKAEFLKAAGNLGLADNFNVHCVQYGMAAIHACKNKTVA